MSAAAGGYTTGVCAVSDSIPEESDFEPRVQGIAGVSTVGWDAHTGSRTPNEPISNPEFRGIRGSGHNPDGGWKAEVWPPYVGCVGAGTVTITSAV